MITKPEEAVPSTYGVPRTTVEVKGFTAKECAEIARAYAQAVEDNRDDPEGPTRRAPNAWRKKFTEWEGK